MPFADYHNKLLGLAKTVYLWLGHLADLDPARRERIARYAETIAKTLARANKALIRLDANPTDRASRSTAVRELARINGYVETIVAVLNDHLDGRKLAGVKRRLERIDTLVSQAGHTNKRHNIRLDRLAAAEGYFRALADGLRA